MSTSGGAENGVAQKFVLDNGGVRDHPSPHSGFRSIPDKNRNDHEGKGMDRDGRDTEGMMMNDDQWMKDG